MKHPTTTRQSRQPRARRIVAEWQRMRYLPGAWQGAILERCRQDVPARLNIFSDNGDVIASGNVDDSRNIGDVGDRWTKN